MNECLNIFTALKSKKYQEVADTLDVERIGPQHQAGSDSLLTGRTFFRMTEIYFEVQIRIIKKLSLSSSWSFNRL